MHKDEKGAAKRFMPGGARAAIGITVFAVFGCGLVYYAYYRNRVDYYTGRNLRLLSTLTSQIDDRIDSFADYVKTNATTQQPVPIDVTPCLSNMTPSSEVVRAVEETETGRQLRLTYSSGGGRCAVLPLDRVIRPIFTRKAAAAFDYLFIAAPDGTVLYTVRPPQVMSTLLRHDEDYSADDESAPRVAKLADRRSDSPLVLNKLNSFTRESPWQPSEPFEPSAIFNRTYHANVAVDGMSYVLFAQPYTFARSTTSTHGKSEQWAVCGLVSASRFHYDVAAVSTTVVLFAVALVALAICAWPFLRVALIDAHQPLTVTDVVLMTFGTMSGAAILTTVFFDCFAYVRTVHTADVQLQRFADDVNDRFTKDVKRAEAALAEIDRITASSLTPGPTRYFPVDVSANAKVRDYPYIDSVAWIDAGGSQKVKYARSERNPLVNVRARRYFDDALHNRTWNSGGQPYVLVEWVRSMATGVVHAVLARHTARTDYPVVAMATQLIDISEAIRPPGVQLAVVDEDGEVVFHSDIQRIGYENFFAEADRSRDLRAIVVARRAGYVSASYWGEGQRMYVRPLQGTPWVLVTFRAERLTRALNMEGAILSVILMTAYATPYVFLCVLILILAPRYRAPSLWPEASRSGDYARLVILLACLFIESAAVVYALTPWSGVFSLTVTLPLAIGVVYLGLHREQRTKFAIAAVLVVANVVLVMLSIVRGDVDFAHRAGTKAILLTAIAVLLAAGAATFHRRWKTPMLLRSVGYATYYRLCGVLLILIGAVLPAAAFFTISCRMATESLVKYGQLIAASDIEHRIRRLATLNLLNGPSEGITADSLNPNLHPVFDTRWTLESSPCGGVRGERCDPMPAGAPSWLPVLYEDSIAVRQLYGPGSADGMWRWCTEGDRIRLQRTIRLDPEVRRSFPEPTPQCIWESSVLPRLSSEGWSSGLAVVFLILAGVGALWFAVNFIATRVLLIDVDRPRWLEQLPRAAPLGQHIFLVRNGRVIKNASGSFDIDFALEDFDRARLPSAETIRINNFEYGIDDPSWNARKLDVLERLLKLADRSVLILSSVGPEFVLTTPVPPNTLDYYDRWHAVLDRFQCIAATDYEEVVDGRVASKPRWLLEETRRDAFLRDLGSQIDPAMGHKQVLDEIGERAEAHYCGIWASCRRDEKLLLYQLACHGLVNAQNRRSLRMLIGRRIINRDSNPMLFNESFRFFVIDVAQREELLLDVAGSRVTSAWDRIRGPLFIIILAFVLLLFTTQKDLMTSTVALATALTTALPMLMKLIGTVADKKAAGDRP